MKQSVFILLVYSLAMLCHAENTASPASAPQNSSPQATITLPDTSSPRSAQSPKNQFAAKVNSAPTPRLSPADAANIVRNKSEGQVMAVSTLTRDSGTVYAVKLLEKGRMRTVLVDGSSGEIK